MVNLSATSLSIGPSKVFRLRRTVGLRRQVCMEVVGTTHKIVYVKKILKSKGVKYVWQRKSMSVPSCVECC